MSLDLQAGADLKLVLQGLSDRLDVMNRFERKFTDYEYLLGRRPLYLTVPPIGKTAGSNTWHFLDCGGPNSGRIRDIRLITVCGDDPSAQQAATSVVAFKHSSGDLPPDGATIPTNLWIINPGFNFPIPVASAFSRDQCFLTYPWKLGIAVKGMANGVNFHVSYAAMDWDADYSLSQFSAP